MYPIRRGTGMSRVSRIVSEAFISPTVLVKSTVVLACTDICVLGPGAHFSVAPTPGVAVHKFPL